MASVPGTREKHPEEKVPAAQVGAQVAAPAGEVVPTGHDWQVMLFAEEFVPGGHVAQLHPLLIIYRSTDALAA